MSAEKVSLQNKIAIVTGAGSGIGRAIAIALAGSGAIVVACGRRLKSIEQTVTMIQQESGRALAIQADVSNPVDVDRLIQIVLDQCGQVDILINNAGISEDTGPVHEMDMSGWDRIFAINLRAPVLMMRGVLPGMRRQRSGHIINISSESGLEHYERDAAYGTSKHALNDLGEYTQRENQDLNIRVNTICPGMVVTEMTQDSPGLDFSKCLMPEDIAELVIFLLTRRENIKIGTPILIQTMLNPWE